MQSVTPKRALYNSRLSLFLFSGALLSFFPFVVRMLPLVIGNLIPSIPVKRTITMLSSSPPLVIAGIILAAAILCVCLLGLYFQKEATPFFSYKRILILSICSLLLNLLILPMVIISSTAVPL